MSSLSPPSLHLQTPSPAGSASSGLGSPTHAAASSELTLPPAAIAASEQSPPQQVQSARHSLIPRAASEPESSHRRSSTALTSPADASFLDWPNQQRQTSNGSSNFSVSPIPFSSAALTPALLHELPPNENVYMQGLLTKKGRNLGFGLGFWRTTRLYMLTDTMLSWTDKSQKNVKSHHLVDSFKSVTRLSSRRWPNRCFSLRFEDDKIYHLRAPTVVECTDWVQALSKAIQNAEKRKARWRFMRDNAQMQQMQQMAQMGAQTQYGTLPMHPHTAALLQQQQQCDLLGMVPMPPNPAMPLNMHPFHFAGPPVPYSPLAFQTPSYIPPNAVVGVLPAELEQASSPPPALNPGLQRMKSSRTRNKEQKEAGQVSLSRTDSKSKSNKDAGSSAAAAPNNTAATAAALAEAAGSGSSSEPDAAGATTTDESETEGFGSADEFAASGEDVEGVDDDYYDEEDDVVDTAYSYPPAYSAAYDPYAAAAYATWQHQVSQSHLQTDGFSLSPAVAAEEQQSLNKSRDRFRYFFMIFCFISTLILWSGNEGTTLKQLSALYYNDPSLAASTASPSLLSKVGALAGAGNATSLLTGSVGVAMPVVRFPVVLLGFSILLTVWAVLRFRAHKKKMKKRQQVKKQQEAAEKALNASQPKKAPTAAETAAAQTKWREESKLLQKEIETTTRLMSILAASAAIMLGTGSYVYRSS